MALNAAAPTVTIPFSHVMSMLKQASIDRKWDAIAQKASA